jgi:DNA-binding XRE family transcriptional regulator
VQTNRGFIQYEDGKSAIRLGLEAITPPAHDWNIRGARRDLQSAEWRERMSKISPRMTWKEFKVIRNIKGYTQTTFGKLLGLKQSAISIRETDHPDELVDPDLAKLALEAPIAGPELDLPAPLPSASEQTVPLFVAKGPLPKGTILVENVLSMDVETSESQTRSFSAVRGRVTPPGPKEEAERRMVTAHVVNVSGSATSNEAEVPSTTTLGRRLLVGFATAACLGCFTLVTGCMLSHRALSDEVAREPERLPNLTSTDKTTEETKDMAQRTRSIPMPEKPYSWQKVAPCDASEVVKGGGCWSELKANPPCPDYAVESEGKCFVPAPAKAVKPNSVTPAK